MRRAAAPQRRRLLRVLLVRLGPLPAEAVGQVASQMSTRRARRGIGKSRRSSSRASTPPRFFSCWKIRKSTAPAFRKNALGGCSRRLRKLWSWFAPVEYSAECRTRTPADAWHRASWRYKAGHTRRLVIAPRPAQEGTNLVPEHTKVTIEMPNRRRLLPCLQFGTGIFVWPAAVTTDRLNFARGLC